MFSLQQIEEAEERVQQWHGEMNRCMTQQRTDDDAHDERRSALRMLVHCYRRIRGRRTEQPSAVPSNVLLFRRESER